MEFLQSSFNAAFNAAFFRLIARDRSLSSAVASISTQLQDNGDLTFQLSYRLGRKNAVLKKLAKIAQTLQQLGNFQAIALSCDGKQQTYRIETLIALCPEVASIIDGPYDKALLDKPLQFSE